LISAITIFGRSWSNGGMAANGHAGRPKFFMLHRKKVVDAADRLPI
jgi:hypothetical protein